MVDFDENSVKNLETLCRIQCTPEERIKISKNLKQVLDYVKELDEVKTEGVEPFSFVLKDMQTNILRKDEIGKTLPREEFLQNSPDHRGGFVIVPPVFNP